MRFLVLWCCKLLGIEGKEILIEGDADSHQQIGSNAIAHEDIIYIGTITAQLLWQPGDRMALSQQFIMDLFSDIYVCFSHQSLSTKEFIGRKINKYLGKTKCLFGFFTQP